MSIKVNIDELDESTRDYINEKLLIKIEDLNGFAPPRSFFLPNIVDEDIYLPFSFAHIELKKPRKKRENYTKMTTEFTGELRPDQKAVKKEAVDFLNQTGSVIISAHPGWGKTAFSINISQAIRLKTLVVINKIVLFSQWEKSINKFCPTARVQKVTPKSKLEDCDFYIINAINVPKMGFNFFRDIGLLIIDECHQIMAESLSKCMQYILPRYVD